MANTIKLALLDFDGTIVRKDILDVLCGLMGKEKESQALNQAFHQGQIDGIQGLVARINFLKGLTRSRIVEVLADNEYLMPGAEALLTFLKQNQIKTILASGNITPVLQYYQQRLGIDFVVGSEVNMDADGETVLGIEESFYRGEPFKLRGINAILSRLQLTQSEIIALGDSPADKAMFGLSSFAIAVNPKGDIAEFAQAVVGEDLQQAVEILKKTFHLT